MLPINTSGLWGDVGPRPLSRNPEATFTPTAAGLRQEGQLPVWPGLPQMATVPPSVGIQDFLAEAIWQGIAAGLQQKAQPPQATAPVLPPLFPTKGLTTSPH